MGTLINLVGKTFGKLTVLERRGNDTHNKNPLWLCICECGNEITLPGVSLKTGNTKTCGCSRGCKSKSNRWLGYQEISKKFWDGVKRTAKKRNIIFDLTIEQMWDLFIEQNGKCALTGQDIYFAPSCKTPGTASLDRINSSRGYTIDNVQWVHKKVNLMKRELDNIEFINFCKMVARYKG